MLIRLSQADDLPAPITPLPFDDDAGEGWFAGAQQSFATIALAGVLAASAFTAKLAAAVQNVDPAEIASGAVVTPVFEDDGFAPPRPIAASPQPRAATLPFADDDAPQIAAPTSTPDEDGFALRQPNYPQSRTAALQFADDDAPLFTAPTFTPEEDTWRCAFCCSPTVFITPQLTDDGNMAPAWMIDEEAVFILRRPWDALDRRNATWSRLYLGDSADLSQFSRLGVILARGAVSASPAHSLAMSAALAHTSAETSAAAHACTAQSAAAHSLTPVAAPAHTFAVEVVI